MGGLACTSTIRAPRLGRKQARVGARKTSLIGADHSDFAARERLEPAWLYRWRERLGVSASQLAASAWNPVQPASKVGSLASSAAGDAAPPLAEEPQPPEITTTARNHSARTIGNGPSRSASTSFEELVLGILQKQLIRRGADPHRVRRRL